MFADILSGKRDKYDTYIILSEPLILGSHVRYFLESSAREDTNTKSGHHNLAEMLTQYMLF